MIHIWLARGILLTVGAVKVEVALRVRNAVFPDGELDNVDSMSHKRQNRKDETLSVHGEFGSSSSRLCV